MTQQCETCAKPIREHCYVSIGPEQQIFCFACCPLAGPPKINPDRIICGGERVALRERLLGRASFCRDRGEIKTPELLEEAAGAIEAKGDIPTLR